MSKLGFFPDTWMGRGVCTSGSAPLTDTFLMARRHTIWPVLNTAETGTWAWSGDAGKMFGGTYTNTSNTANDSFSLENLNLFSATAAINLLYTKASTGGLCDVYWGTKGEAGDLLATIDMYAASTQKNQVAQFSLGTVTKARKTLHFVMRAGTGGGYTCQIQQAEVVQLTGSNLGDSIDDLPWWVDVPPFAYATADRDVLDISTVYGWGSTHYISLFDAQGATYKVGLTPGTWMKTLVHRTAANQAILDFSLDNGVGDLGSIDAYTAPTVQNVKSTLTGISVSNAAVHTLTVVANGNNVASSGFRSYNNWMQFRKTNAHGAITATGATYGRESAEFWPWFAATGGYNTFSIASSELYYGSYFNSGSTQDDYLEWAQSLLSGTYAVDTYGYTASNLGITHLTLDGGSDIDTVDHNGITVPNAVLSMSGSLSPGALRMQIKTKTGTAYRTVDRMIRAVRTGA